jgi:hypothetical protein
MIVKTFANVNDLQAYITANSVTVAKTASIYFDAASGHHVIVHAP